MPLRNQPPPVIRSLTVYHVPAASSREHGMTLTCLFEHSWCVKSCKTNSFKHVEADNKSTSELEWKSGKQDNRNNRIMAVSSQLSKISSLDGMVCRRINSWLIFLLYIYICIHKTGSEKYNSIIVILNMNSVAMNWAASFQVFCNL